MLSGHLSSSFLGGGKWGRMTSNKLQSKGRTKGQRNELIVLECYMHRVLAFDAQRSSESALKVTAPDRKNGETTMQGPKKVKQREQLRLSWPSWPPRSHSACFFLAIYLLFFEQKIGGSSIPTYHANQSIITAIKCYENSVDWAWSPSSRRSSTLVPCHSWTARMGGGRVLSWAAFVGNCGCKRMLTTQFPIFKRFCFSQHTSSCRSLLAARTV